MTAAPKEPRNRSAAGVPRAAGVPSPAAGPDSRRLTGGKPPVGWDLSHVRAGFVAMGALAVVGVPLAWLLRDGRAAACVLAGLALVAVFFSVSAYAVARAGRASDSLLMPVAMGTYAAKILLLGVLLVAVRDEQWLDRRAFGLAVVAGTLAWTGVHARRVWTGPLYYVDRPGR